MADTLQAVRVNRDRLDRWLVWASILVAVIAINVVFYVWLVPAYIRWAVG